MRRFQVFELDTEDASGVGMQANCITVTPYQGAVHAATRYYEENGRSNVIGLVGPSAATRHEHLNPLPTMMFLYRRDPASPIGTTNIGSSELSRIGG